MHKTSTLQSIYIWFTQCNHVAFLLVYIDKAKNKWEKTEATVICDHNDKLKDSQEEAADKEREQTA